MFFPEFRGGIYAYLDEIGAQTIVAELMLMVEQHGERFQPCEWLVTRAAQQAEAAA